MGSHNVTCHPTQAGEHTPALTPASKAGTQFTYPGGMEDWVDLDYTPAENRTRNRLIESPIPYRCATKKQLRLTLDRYNPSICTMSPKTFDVLACLIAVVRPSPLRVVGITELVPSWLLQLQATNLSHWSHLTPTRQSTCSIPVMHQQCSLR